MRGAQGTDLYTRSSICGMRVCLLVELSPWEETDNVRSAGTIAACPTQRAQLAGGGLEAWRPLWDNKDPSIPLLPLLPSLPSLIHRWPFCGTRSGWSGQTQELQNRTEKNLQKHTPTHSLFLVLCTLSTGLLCISIWIQSGSKHHCVLLEGIQQLGLFGAIFIGETEQEQTKVTILWLKCNFLNINFCYIKNK